MHYLIGFLLFSLVCAFFKWFFPALLECLLSVFWFFYFITWLLDCFWRVFTWAFAGKKGTKPRFHTLYSPQGLWGPPDPDDPADLDAVQDFYDPIKKRRLQKILIAALLIASVILLIYCLREGRKYRMRQGYRIPQAQAEVVQRNRLQILSH